MRKAAFVYDEVPTRRDSRAYEIFGPTHLQYTTEKLRWDSRIEARARRSAEESVAQVKRLVFPHHGL